METTESFNIGIEPAGVPNSDSVSPSSSTAIATIIKLIESLPEATQEQVLEHLREDIADLQKELTHAPWEISTGIAPTPMEVLDGEFAIQTYHKGNYLT